MASFAGGFLHRHTAHLVLSAEICEVLLRERPSEVATHWLKGHEQHSQGISFDVSENPSRTFQRRLSRLPPAHQEESYDLPAAVVKHASLELRTELFGSLEPCSLSRQEIIRDNITISYNELEL